MMVGWQEIMETCDNNKELMILQTKFKMKQASEIYCELLKIREGLVKYTCRARNLLQVFSGEMELYCFVDINKEVENLKFLLDKGISFANWENVNEITLELYSKILSFCSGETLK